MVEHIGVAEILALVDLESLFLTYLFPMAEQVYIYRVTQDRLEFPEVFLISMSLATKSIQIHHRRLQLVRFLMS